MKDVELLPLDHKSRIKLVLDQSWTIFTSYLVNGKHSFTKEAPFQHHFANIISSIGSLYCISPTEHFYTDLETKYELKNGKSKYIDITCGFRIAGGVVCKCAIELKFKTKEQGAQDHGRIDAYVDIHALEQVVESEYAFGRFFMITDSQAYVNPPRKEGASAGNIFATFDGYKSPAERLLQCRSKGREDIAIQLHNQYTFDWKSHSNWYFLEIEVKLDANSRDVLKKAS